MKNFECEDCGVEINSKAVIKIFPNKLTSKAEVTKEVYRDRPLIRCHNSDCRGFLRVA